MNLGLWLFGPVGFAGMGLATYGRLGLRKVGAHYYGAPTAWFAYWCGLLLCPAAVGLAGLGAD